MNRKEKVYKIHYILSNGKIVSHPDKRSKTIKEWEEVSQLFAEEVVKYLKLDKGKNKEKYKDTSVVEIRLLDWRSNVLVNKVFDEEVGEESEDINKN